jgi:hypothetical protein
MCWIHHIRARKQWYGIRERDRAIFLLLFFSAFRERAPAIEGSGSFDSPAITTGQAIDLREIVSERRSIEGTFTIARAFTPADFFRSLRGSRARRPTLRTGAADSSWQIKSFTSWKSASVARYVEID